MRSANSDLDTQTILIVEDDAGLQELISNLMQRKGFRCHGVCTGREAMAWLTGHQADLLLLDYSLPDMTGSELVGGMAERGTILPFIMTTGQEDERIVMNMLKHGASDYLVKNMTLFDRLPIVVTRVLQEIQKERKLAAAEAALQEREEQLQLFLANSNDGFWDWNIGTGAVYFSPQWQDMLGYKEGELNPHIRSWEERIHPEDMPVVREALNDYLVGHTSCYNVEYRLLTRSGAWKWVLTRGKIVTWNEHGRPLRLTGTQTDIHERRWMTEALQQANESLREHERRVRELVEENKRLREQTQQDSQIKASLIHEVNHRVKNNLTAIIGLLAMEQQRSAREMPACQDTLQDMQNRIQSMVTVHRMLATTQWRPLPLNDLVLRVIEGVVSSLPARQKIQVVAAPPPALLHIAPKPATALATVVNELMTNSVKYAFQERGRGRFEVQITHEDDRDQGQIKLEFRDDGPGWPEDVLNGQRESIGLRLIRMSVINSLRGAVALRNENGAVTTITLKLVALN